MNESNLRARIKNSIRRPKKIFEHSLVNGYLDSTSLNSQERVSLFSNNFQPSMDNETMCSLKQKLHILNK